MYRLLPPDGLEFQQYKDNLKEFLRSYHNFTDYDFEGSNITVLIDLLTASTYNNALYLNMVGSEAFMDSAQLRDSVVSHAKDLNYLPRSRVSARGLINIEVVPNDAPSSVTIPRHYKFRSSAANGNTIYFITEQSYTVARSQDGRYVFNNVEVFQGEILNDYYEVTDIDGSNGYTKYLQSFIVSSPNVDASSIEVFISPSRSATNTQTVFNRATSIVGVTNNSNIFYVQATFDNRYAVEFGDGVLGSALSEGNYIQIRYRNTLGGDIRGTYVLTKTTDIQGYSNITVQSPLKVTPGAFNEDTESIRLLAPKYFQTQDRAIVPQDFEVLIKKNFPFVQQIHVFGGEEIYQYGKIMVVIKPYSRSGNISDNLKRQIVSYIKTKNMVPEPVILDPEYFYLSVSGNVFYNKSVTDFTVDQIKTSVVTALTGLNEDNMLLSNFNVNIYQSKITETINKSNVNIVGSDVETGLVYRWTPPVDAWTELKFSTDNRIKSSQNGVYSSFDSYGVITNAFTFNNGIVNTSVILKDDGIGNIYMYSIGDEENSQIGSAVGSVNYETGDVSINRISIAEYNDGINFRCVLANDSIQIKYNKFVVSSSEYINLEMVSK